MYERFFEECEEIEIPDELKTIFRFPSTYIEKNIYKDRGHNFNLERYSIRYFKVKSEESGIIPYGKKTIHIDFCNFFLLFYEDLPVAIISFEIYSDEKIVLIGQIQGIYQCLFDKGETSNFHISFFYWQKVLVEYVEIYFKFMKFEKIEIQKAESNGYYPGKLNLKLKGQLEINYDKVASDMGYVEKSSEFSYSFIKDLKHFKIFTTNR